MWYSVSLCGLWKNQIREVRTAVQLLPDYSTQKIIAIINVVFRIEIVGDFGLFSERFSGKSVMRMQKPSI